MGGKKTHAKTIQLLTPAHNTIYTPGVITFTWKYLTTSKKKTGVILKVERLDGKKKYAKKVFKEKNKILKLDYYLKTKAFFDKHGGKAVIFSRFMPIIRTIAPFVAGVGKMPFLRYSLYNIIGGAAWIILFLFAGYELGTVILMKSCEQPAVQCC